MMAAILNSTMLDSDTAILDSDTFLSSLRFTQKHSPSTLTLTQTNSIWLKLIHSHSTWWWQPSWFCHLEFGHLGCSHLGFSSQTHSHLPRLVPTICTKKPSLVHSDSTWWWQPSWILPCWIKKTSLIHSDSPWLWQPSWIVPSWIQTPSYLLSDSLKNTLPPFWLWLKLIQCNSNSFILTQLDDGSHLEFGHPGFCHLRFSSQTHSHLPRLVPNICTKKRPSFIHSGSTWWWQPSWILPSWILPSWIQPFCTKLWLKLIQSDSNSFILTQLDSGRHPEFGHLGFSHLSFSSQTHSHLTGLVPTICTKKTSLTLPSPPFAQKKLHSFILTQLNDGSHLDFYHVGLKNFTHSFWLNLMMAAILNSTMLD